jgi:hypothetical protein
MEKRMTTDKIGLEHKSFAFGHDSKQTELQLRDGFSIIVNVQYVSHDIPSRLALDRSTPCCGKQTQTNGNALISLSP